MPTGGRLDARSLAFVSLPCLVLSMRSRCATESKRDQHSNEFLTHDTAGHVSILFTICVY